MDGGIPLGLKTSEKELLKTADQEQSRLFTIDQPLVNLKVEKVLINEIDPYYSV